MLAPLHDSQQLDSNQFCTILRLPASIYEAETEPPDNPKVIIQHSNMDYVYKRSSQRSSCSFELISVIGSHRRTSQRRRISPENSSTSSDLAGELSDSSDLITGYRSVWI
ncbi:hypothetical protein F2Q69_00036473 [Brassica cretica]|uniref:Uncharacterized protein n=1 Tax=Brassica cretica TaxID=69181 RepID=A0A8S9SEM5_BRACR|nr:hypothetical protein F2Q69_00036473 [Brassica cretica]